MINPAVSRALASLKKHCGIEPYWHQAEGDAAMMECFERFQSGALLHDMGTGKSLSSIGLFLEMYARGEATIAFTACPLSVIGSWEADGAKAGVDVVALTGTGAKKQVALQRALLLQAETRKPMIVVLNYESTWRTGMKELLIAARFDIIFGDEVQRLKAAGSKQSRGMHQIGKRAKYRLGLTGTPVSEGALGYYGIFRFIDDRLFGTNHANFLARYATQIPMGLFKKTLMNKAMLPELEALVMERSHRVTKADALDLPEEMDVVVPFSLSPRVQKVYDQLRKDSLAILEDEFGQIGEIVAETALTKLLRLQQATGGFAQLDDGPLADIDDPKGPSKRRVLADLMESVIESGEKVVVFHRFTAEGDAIRKIAEEMGAQPAWINGKVKGADRGEMVRRFQEDPECKVFVAQIQAAGLGITLTSSNTSIFYSMGFSGGDYQQAKARVHRIGQESKVTHYHLCATGSIDEMVYDALQDKKSIADDLLDKGWLRYLGGSND